MKAAGFARWSVDGITRKANSIARSLRLIGSWARPLSHSFTRSRLLTDSSPEVPSAMADSTWRNRRRRELVAGKFRCHLRRHHALLLRPHPFAQHHECASWSIRRTRFSARSRDHARAFAKRSARAGDLHRFLRDKPERSYCGLLGFSKLWGTQTD